MFKKLKQLGPGVIVAAAFIGPGTVTTATLAGAGYGYTLLWAILFSIFATVILQEMSARLGIVAKIGVGEALRKKAKTPALKIAVVTLVIGAILVGNAAYEAGNISGAVLGFPSGEYSINPFIVIIGAAAFILLFTGQYRLIEKSLVILVSVMGIVFLISAILLKPDVSQIISGLFKPILPENAGMMVIGLIGTTVVPYNIFLHASSVKTKWKNESAIGLARWDTILSISLGGIITMAILITSAVAFQNGNSNISGLEDLSFQLEPILGNWATTFVGFGFLAAGLSSSVTAPLAAAFAVSEVLGWQNNLKSTRFRLTWGFVLFTGILFSMVGFKPTSVILFAQVANGLLLPVVAGFLVWVMNDKTLMGKNANSVITNGLGIIIILITIALGLKSVLTAFGYI